MASPSPEKRCLYEVLNLPIDCSPDEIRSAYRRLALQRHPDKLVQSGLSPSDATALFQELVNAYEVLSDPRERTWYDSHRSQILFSNPSSSSSSSSSSIPNLFPFFSNSVFSGFSDSGKGFFKVYADVFDKIFANEVDFARKLRLRTPVKEAPLLGNLKSPYTQVKAFYDYWLGFLTVMDFCWVDQYDSVSGVNRKSRRVMEDENKKLRKKAKREFNETVRGLAEFAKKRDKRVIDMMVKREAEMEKKREEERERKKEREREKAERLRAYEEPEWAKVDEEIERGLLKEELMEDGNEKERQEFYCVACGKKFKSDKQWKNHEQSKKHKEKVSYLRHSLLEDDEILGEKGLGGGFSVNGDAGESSFEHKGDGVDELNKKLKDDFKIETEDNGEAEVLSVAEEEAVTETVKMTDDSFGLDDENVVVLEDSESEALSCADEADDVTRSDNITSESFGSDDESSVLEAMVSGHRSERKETRETQTKPSPENAHDDLSGDNLDFMEYNNRKTRRRKKEGKKGKAKVFDEEPMRDNDTGSNTVPEESDVHESSVLENAPSHSLEKNDNEDDANYQSKRKHHKGSSSKQPVERKSTLKQETDSKSKSSLKGGRKQKV